MTQEPDRFLHRMRWVFLLFALILLIWQFLPWIEQPHRPVAPRLVGQLVTETLAPWRRLHEL